MLLIAAYGKKINFEDNQKQYILEVSIIIAFLGFDQSDFSYKINLILRRKKFDVR